MRMPLCWLRRHKSTSCIDQIEGMVAGSMLPICRISFRRDWTPPLGNSTPVPATPSTGFVPPRCSCPILSTSSSITINSLHFGLETALSNHYHYPTLFEFPSRAAPRDEGLNASVTDTDFFMASFNHHFSSPIITIRKNRKICLSARV